MLTEGADKLNFAFGWVSYFTESNLPLPLSTLLQMFLPLLNVGRKLSKEVQTQRAPPKWKLISCWILILLQL